MFDLGSASKLTAIVREIQKTSRALSTDTASINERLKTLSIDVKSLVTIAQAAFIGSSPKSVESSLKEVQSFLFDKLEKEKESLVKGWSFWNRDDDDDDEEKVKQRRRPLFETNSIENIEILLEKILERIETQQQRPQIINRGPSVLGMITERVFSYIDKKSQFLSDEKNTNNLVSSTIQALSSSSIFSPLVGGSQQQVTAQQQGGNVVSPQLVVDQATNQQQGTPISPLVGGGVQQQGGNVVSPQLVVNQPSSPSSLVFSPLISGGDKEQGENVVSPQLVVDQPLSPSSSEQKQKNLVKKSIETLLSEDEGNEFFVPYSPDDEEDDPVISKITTPVTIEENPVSPKAVDFSILTEAVLSIDKSVKLLLKTIKEPKSRFGDDYYRKDDDGYGFRYKSSYKSSSVGIVSKSLDYLTGTIKNFTSSLGGGFIEILEEVSGAIGKTIAFLGSKEVLRGAASIGLLSTSLLFFSKALLEFAKVPASSVIKGSLAVSFLGGSLFVLAKTAPFLSPAIPVLYAFSGLILALSSAILVGGEGFRLFALGIESLNKSAKSFDLNAVLDLALGMSTMIMALPLGWLLLAGPSLASFGLGLLSFSIALKTIKMLGVMGESNLDSWMGVINFGREAGKNSAWFFLAGIGLTSLGVGLTTIALPIALMNKLDFRKFVGNMEYLTDGLLSLTEIGILGGVGLGVVGAGLVFLGAGLLALGTGIYMLSSISEDTMKKMVDNLGNLMWSISWMALYTPFILLVSASLAALGVSLLSLSAGFGALSLVDFSNAMQAVGVIAAFSGVISLLSVMAIPILVVSKGLAVLGLSLISLSIGLNAFSGIDFATIGKGALALVLIGGASYALALSSPTMIASSIGLTALSLGLGVLSLVDWESLSMAGREMIMIASGATLLGLSAPASLLAAGALVMLGGALGLFSWLSEGLSGAGENLLKMAKAFSELSGLSFFGLSKAGAAISSFAAGVSSGAKKLASSNEGVERFINQISSIVKEISKIPENATKKLTSLSGGISQFISTFSGSRLTRALDGLFKNDNFETFFMLMRRVASGSNQWEILAKSIREVTNAIRDLSMLSVETPELLFQTFKSISLGFDELTQEKIEENKNKALIIKETMVSMSDSVVIGDKIVSQRSVDIMAGNVQNKVLMAQKKEDVTSHQELIERMTNQISSAISSIRVINQTSVHNGNSLVNIPLMAENQESSFRRVIG